MLNATQIRVAVIDDDEDDYFIIADYINDIEGSNFVIDWCNDYDKAILSIRERKYDVYFVDYRLGQHTGLELLQEVSSHGLGDPIVLLTGKGNKDIDIKAMESGATDYLVKSELTTEKLERCIRYSLDRSAYLKELTTRENKYRNLFENSRDAIFIADQQLVFLEVNQAATLLFSSPSHDLLKGCLFDFIKNKSQKQRVTELFREENDIRNLEIEIESKKGELKSCMLTLTFLEDNPGDKLVHGILHDISSIKKAEIANLHAQKLAANERLIQILAHEIRNPLNNISLSLEQLSMQADAAEDNQFLVSIMQRNTGRINNIITELLNQTKPIELNFQSYSLQEMLDESISMTADRINLQQINLQKKYPDIPAEIKADKSKLVIAFNNILVNAVEAIENGNGELDICITSTPDQYMVSIKDNGKGIPDQYISKLFEPFFTLKQKGVGLGLSATYSIVQSHQGNIQVKSQPNKGTTFLISFAKNNN
jgi:PAS domain S-box-containing protein